MLAEASPGDAAVLSAYRQLALAATDRFVTKVDTGLLQTPQPAVSAAGIFALGIDEVCTLASRTQRSTEEIQAMIERLQGNARAAVSAMEQGDERSRRTVGQAEEAERALLAITGAVEKITLMSQQIASAVEEQSCVAEEINRNVSNVRDIAEATAAEARAASASCENLRELAAGLRGRTGQFRI